MMAKAGLPRGVCGLGTASEVFLIFITRLYQRFRAFFLFMLFSDEPEVFLPKYSQTVILHAAHFRRVVNVHIVATMQMGPCVPVCLHPFPILGPHHWLARPDILPLLTICYWQFDFKTCDAVVEVGTNE